jgi:hypothetical protein
MVTSQIRKFFSLKAIRSQPEVIPVLIVLGAGCSAAVLMLGRQSAFNPDVALFDKTKAPNGPDAATTFEERGLFGRFAFLRANFFPGTKTYKSTPEVEAHKLDVHIPLIPDNEGSTYHKK